MLSAAGNYYLKQEEPIKSYLLTLRELIMQFDANLSETAKYGMPFFLYKKKMCCYLWVHKKSKKPYIGIVEGARMKHSQLIQENRARMKIMLFDPEKDVPVKTINALLKEMVALYQ